MDTNFNVNKSNIIDALKAKVTNFECPFCKQKKFTLGGGYFAHDLQKDLQSRIMGGVNIPTVPIICDHCGFVAEFAVGSLGLLPKVADLKNE
jgi:hypothetical protein